MKPFFATLAFVALLPALCQSQISRALTGAQAANLANGVSLTTVTVGQSAANQRNAPSMSFDFGSTYVNPGMVGQIPHLVGRNQYLFGYNNAYYAYWITVQAYKGAAANVPLIKTVPGIPTPLPNVPFIPQHEYVAVSQAVRYFTDGMPGWSSMKNDPPSEIKVDLGLNDPEPRWVINPLMGTYTYDRTRFVRQLRVRVQ